LLLHVFTAVPVCVYVVLSLQQLLRIQFSALRDVRCATFYTRWRGLCRRCHVGADVSRWHRQTFTLIRCHETSS